MNAPRLPAARDDDDDALFSAWSDGDARAFDELVARHGPALHQLLLTRLNDPSQADDAWSETFLRVIRSRHRYVPSRSFRAWLFSIGRRCAVDQQRSSSRLLRSSRRLFEGSPGRPVQPPGPDQAPIRAEQRRAIQEALTRLPEVHRRVVLLCCRDEASAGEVGRILGLSSQQVRDRLAYARKLLTADLAGLRER